MSGRGCAALASGFVEGQAGVGVNGVASRECLPPPDSDVDEAGLDLQRACTPTGALGRQDGGPGAAKCIQHDVAARSAISHRVRDQRHRLDRGMSLEFIQPSDAEGVDACVSPQVRA